MDKKRKISIGVSAGVIATAAIVVPISILLTKKSSPAWEAVPSIQKESKVLKDEPSTKGKITKYLSKRNWVTRQSHNANTLDGEWEKTDAKDTDEYYFREVDLDKILKSNKGAIDFVADLLGVKRDWILNVINNPSDDHLININGRKWSPGRMIISGIYTSKSGKEFDIINPMSFASNGWDKLTSTDYIKFFEDTIDLYTKNGILNIK